MRRVLLVLVGLLAALVAAWILDVRSHEGEALRNVEVAGRDVGGEDRSGVEAAARAAAEAYAASEVAIRTPDGDIEAAAADIGLEVDVDATVQRALDAGRDDPLPLRPIRWARSLLSSREAGVAVTLDPAAVRRLIRDEDPTGRTEPTEPGVTGVDGQLAVVIGENGEGIDAAEVAAAIVDAAASGRFPIAIDVAPGSIAPRFTRADAEGLADRARELTSEPVDVTAGEAEAAIEPSMLRSWVRSSAAGDELELDLDAGEVIDDLAELLESAGTQPVDAQLTVEGGRPVIRRGREGTTCCAPDAAVLLLGAVKAGDTGPIRLPLATAEPDTTTADLEALEITEEIGSFTTNHKAGESRVTNIHRMADLVRGVVLEPGERFSINDHVGKRTTENGFVVGGVIENGVFSESVGGGVSQFATTLFNAAFFGGLDIAEYQSHSIYISRYPYGREATLSYPKPDLVIENSTPHGVLIWPSYTNTSVTVTLYSTRYARGEQTGQTEAPVGTAGCKRVTTERTRTYVDGHTAVDKVYAVYRPSEGVQC